MARLKKVHSRSPKSSWKNTTVQKYQATVIFKQGRKGENGIAIFNKIFGGQSVPSTLFSMAKRFVKQIKTCFTVGWTRSRSLLFFTKAETDKKCNKNKKAVRKLSANGPKLKQRQLPKDQKSSLPDRNSKTLRSLKRRFERLKKQGDKAPTLAGPIAALPPFVVSDVNNVQDKPHYTFRGSDAVRVQVTEKWPTKPVLRVEPVTPVVGQINQSETVEKKRLRNKKRIRWKTEAMLNMLAVDQNHEMGTECKDTDLRFSGKKSRYSLKKDRCNMVKVPQPNIGPSGHSFKMNSSDTNDWPSLTGSERPKGLIKDAAILLVSSKQVGSVTKNARKILANMTTSKPTASDKSQHQTISYNLRNQQQIGHVNVPISYRTWASVAQPLPSSTKSEKIVPPKGFLNPAAGFDVSPQHNSSLSNSVSNFFNQTLGSKELSNKLSPDYSKRKDRPISRKTSAEIGEKTEMRKALKGRRNKLKQRCGQKDQVVVPITSQRDKRIKKAERSYGKIDKVRPRPRIKPRSSPWNGMQVDEILMADQVVVEDHVPVVNQIPGVDEVDEVPEVDQKPATYQMPGVEKMPGIEKMTTLDHLPELDQMPGVVQLSRAVQMSRLEKMSSVSHLPAVSQMPTVNQMPVVNSQSTNYVVFVADQLCPASTCKNVVDSKNKASLYIQNSQPVVTEKIKSTNVGSGPERIVNLESLPEVSGNGSFNIKLKAPDSKTSENICPATISNDEAHIQKKKISMRYRALLRGEKGGVDVKHLTEVQSRNKKAYNLCQEKDIFKTKQCYQRRGKTTVQLKSRDLSTVMSNGTLAESTGKEQEGENVCRYWLRSLQAGSVLRPQNSQVNNREPKKDNKGSPSVTSGTIPSIIASPSRHSDYHCL